MDELWKEFLGNVFIGILIGTFVGFMFVHLFFQDLPFKTYFTRRLKLYNAGYDDGYKEGRYTEFKEISNKKIERLKRKMKKAQKRYDAFYLEILKDAQKRMM